MLEGICKNKKCDYYNEGVFDDYSHTGAYGDFLVDPGGHVVNEDSFYKNGKLCCPSCDQPLEVLDANT